MAVVGFGSLAAGAGHLGRCCRWARPFSWVNLVGAVLIVLFGFLFVTVSSRLTGEIGSSSNPISGHDRGHAAVDLPDLPGLLGWTEPPDRLMALSVAAVVCVASSNGGTTSQDLKTGYLVGATPKYQQLAILVGSVTSALVIGWILLLLNQASTVYTKRPENLPTPKHPPARGDAYRPGDRAHGDKPGTAVPRVAGGRGRSRGARHPRGKYLVDDTGRIRYLVDPGINGQVIAPRRRHRGAASSSPRRPS